MEWSIGEILRATGGSSALPEDKVVRRVVIDSRLASPGSLFIALKGERHDGHSFVAQALATGATAALVSTPPQGVDSGRCIFVPDTLEALGRLAAWTRRREDWRVVGLTGSAGKTTTKEMIAAICAQARGSEKVLKTLGNWNNLVGLPLTIFSAQGGEEIAVLEMGMNRFGEIRRLAEIADPDVGLITNVGLAHAGGVGGTQEGVARAKGELIEVLKPTATFVVNADDEWVCRLAERFHGPKIRFGSGGEVQAHWIRDLGIDGVVFELDLAGERAKVRLRLLGVHNVSNALAAAAAGLAMGFRVEVIAAGLESVDAVAGRMEVVRLRNGVTVLDDTYNANPSSVEAALKVLRRFPGRPLVVLGAMLELGGESQRAHRQVGERVATLDVAALVLLGQETEATAEAARAAGLPAERIYSCRDCNEAAQTVVNLWRSGDVVLVKGSHSLHMEEVIRSLAISGNSS
ncbi:MAG: UDP-N-acetylmuramoyl-tripeptide--D-alanyl-D-alanine ligase [Candidatus Binatia bacterium]|nr:UDP-N-acetylmuramoyl-tripeptide--D-alanyl-D-alanine ligase [Candidatus Binatia bacterium]